MADLQEQFERASQDAQQLPSRPDDATMLQLYGLYKQGTEGDVDGKRPGRLNMVARAKHDAWAERQGMAQDDARQAYVDLVQQLRGG